MNSGNPAIALTGDSGAEFNEMTEGGAVKEAGARMVKLRSSFDKFVA